MTSWHSYPKVFAVGHKAVRPILENDVLVEEKIDGSQFSFGLINGELRTKSHNREFPVDAPDGMFKQACATVLALASDLHPDWTYRAEYLQTPKHNVLRYDRAPERNLIIFDIGIGHEDYLDPADKWLEAKRLGLECVPQFLIGRVESAEHFRSILDTSSVLGGTKVEGVVVKNYVRFTEDGHPMFAKYVSEAFKEAMHAPDSPWAKVPKPFVLDSIAANYATGARWQKSVQRMAEEGILAGEPKDIGTLVRYVMEDIKTEERDSIKGALFAHYGDDIIKKSVRGLAEWYKERLLDSAFSPAGVFTQQEISDLFDHECDPTVPHTISLNGQGHVPCDRVAA